MTTPANYATLIAEIDVVIESYGLSLQEVFGGRSTQPTLQELIDLRYELFEVDGGGGSSDPSQIVSSTLPTTRVNPSTGLPSGGDPLQIGDRWYKPSVGQEGFWNGTLWLSTTEYILCTAPASNIAATTVLGLILNPSPMITENNAVGQLNAFITRCLLHTNAMATNNTDNHWSCTLGAQNGFGTGVNFAPAVPAVNTIDSVSQGGGRRKNTPINLLLTAIPYNITATITKVGSPSNLVAHFIYMYRIVL